MEEKMHVEVGDIITLENNKEILLVDVNNKNMFIGLEIDKDEVPTMNGCLIKKSVDEDGSIYVNILAQGRIDSEFFTQILLKDFFDLDDFDDLEDVDDLEDADDEDL